MLTLLLACAGRAAPAPASAHVAQPCPATALEDRLPGVVGPMAGSDPVWMVDGSTGLWGRPEAAVKTAWVVARAAEGPIEVEGRRHGRDGSLRFRLGVDGPITDRLVIEEPRSRSVVPGGATPQIVERYSFLPSYVIYPQPGCWELSVRVGGQRRRIVVEQRVVDRRD